MRTVGLHPPDSSSIFANMGFKGNSAILMPSGSVSRQSLSRPAMRTTIRRHVPLCWKMHSCCRIKDDDVCWNKVSKGWVMHYHTQSDTWAPLHYKKKRSAFSSWIFNLKNWYFPWLLFKDFIIRKWPCSLLLLPLSPCPQQPHSGPIFSTDCSSQGPNNHTVRNTKGASGGSAAFDSVDHSTLETLFPGSQHPLPPPAPLPPPLLLPVTSGSSSMSHGRCPRMTSHALHSSLTMWAITGHDYESKHLPRSLFGANTRAVCPAASWAVYWTRQADSFNSPHPSLPLCHWPISRNWMPTM